MGVVGLVSLCSGRCPRSNTPSTEELEGASESVLAGRLSSDARESVRTQSEGELSESRSRVEEQEPFRSVLQSELMSVRGSGASVRGENRSRL